MSETKHDHALTPEAPHAFVSSGVGYLGCAVCGRGKYASRHAPLYVAAFDLLAALREFEVIDCEGGCDGSGKEPGDGHNACRTCGGTGLEIRGGDPHAIRNAIAKAEGR